MVQRCTAPGALSDFYRNMYGLGPGQGPLIPDSEEAWRALPFVTKKDLLRYPSPARSYMPLKEIDSLYVSSGTSGSPPLFMLRARLRGWEYRMQYGDFMRPALSSMGFPHRTEYFLEQAGRPARLVVFDPKHPEASVRLACAIGIESLFLHTYLLPLAGKLLSQARAAKNITCIDMAGEPCSLSLFTFIRETFPKAVIIADYGATEIDSPMAVTCQPLTDAYPQESYHPLKEFFLEIIDPDTGSVLEPKEGVEGELVVTAHTGDMCAFPLVRYRIGDMVRVTHERCAQHGQWTFAVLGRVGLDFLKVPGGVLRADEVTRVLRSIKNRVEDIFTLEVSETSSSTSIRTRAVLFIKPTQPLDMERLAQEIAGTLRVGPSSSYADGVARGLYDPLICRELPSVTEFKKQRKIVRAAHNAHGY